MGERSNRLAASLMELRVEMVEKLCLALRSFSWVWVSLSRDDEE